MAPPDWWTRFSPTSPSANGCSRFRRSQLHNAHVSSRVAIHYRWHPCFGRSLAVARRAPRAGRAFIYCELPDGTVAGIPAWMADAALCALHSLGPPEVSVGALIELRRLLDACRRPGAAEAVNSTVGQRTVGPRLRRGDRR